MVILLLAVALLVFSVAFLVLCAGGLRAARNFGRLDLEDYARRNDLAYIPISRQLVRDSEEWSSPLVVRMQTHANPLLIEMICKVVDEPDVAQLNSPA